jgi:DNA-binding PadR family transcriptional regulator
MLICQVVYIESPNLLTPFQRWALLHLHSSETSSSGLDILKACCITAMTDNFQKKDATEGLAKLEKMGLINKKQSMLKNSVQADPELSDFYSITGEGVIYTKKMLKPVLDLLSDSEKVEKIAQKLTDGKTKSWLRNVLKSSASMVQQQVLERTIAYGLGNISGLSQLLDALRKNLLSPS